MAHYNLLYKLPVTFKVHAEMMDINFIFAVICILPAFHFIITSVNVNILTMSLVSVALNIYLVWHLCI